MEPSKVNPWWALLSVALGQFMVIVDVTILNIALPALAADFEASLPDLEWALISYSLTMTGLLPIFGRISDVFGRKRLYLAGVVVFALASGLAALSPSIGALIGARILQAVGGALITANTLAILTDVFPAGKRGIAMGIQSILISGGAAVGPVLGGILVTGFGWEAVFLVNLPIGLCAVLLAWRVLPSFAPQALREELDWIGAGLLLAGLLATLSAISRAPQWGWLSLPTIALLAVGVALLAVFARRQTRVRHPLIKPSLIKVRAFLTGQLAGFFSTMTLVSMVFLMPFYWQSLRGFDARETGLLMLPSPIMLMVMAPIAGRLSDRIGARGLTTAALVIAALASLLIAQIGPRTSIPDVVWRLALFGAGLGLFLAPNQNAVMNVAPASDRGVASGLLALFRFTGQAVAIVFAGTLFLHAAGHGHGGELIRAEADGSAGAALAGVDAEAFLAGFRTVCLALVPVALLGAALSFARGGERSAGS